MTISYKWLGEYLPVQIEPDRLSRILTSVGLEVESMHSYEEVKGSLQGLVIGEVLETEKHPNADKLTLTKVDIGNGETLQIVCGAPNVAAGQKVVVATPGTTIHPMQGEAVTMKIARIRGVESQGMICAEDEIGLGNSHAGIMVLPAAARVGTAANDYFKPYTDTIYEIGLTPNRMDAMSHWGVARDVCAYLSHHEKKDFRAKLPNGNGFKVDNNSLPVRVTVEDPGACPRYSGVSVSGVKIEPSPAWMQQRLKSIGIRPINNIVDITNYIQHETGQPLHAFDADKIAGKHLIVKMLPAGTPFTTLDEKVRTLHGEDLMICDEKGGSCIAGVFGGLHSGVTEGTKNIFLESAFFEAVAVRKTSFRHGLRTDSASRFEKGTDISATVPVLKRAAGLIREITGAVVSSEIVDIYPDPRSRTEVGVKYHYLKKLSGKNYHPDTLKNILGSLGFDIIKEGIDEMRVAVPYHKPDISLPADLVEEILRIDGLDNIDIPASITITPSADELEVEEAYREKISNLLTGIGFHEIMTNSITNADYYSDQEKGQMIQLLNSLSVEHNIMRNSLFETSMEVIARNLNHKNLSLRLFEFGQAYQAEGPGKYLETKQLCIVITGDAREAGWKENSLGSDGFYLKSVVTTILKNMGIVADQVEPEAASRFGDHLVYKKNGNILAGGGSVKRSVLAKFGIRQPVYYAGFNWEQLLELATAGQLTIRDLPRFPAVQRDLALIVKKETPWEKVENSVQKIKLDKLRGMKLFDIFESDKLGTGKKSLAVNFTFRDDEKTLTDKEIDEWMNRIMSTLEKELSAEIRK